MAHFAHPDDLVCRDDHHNLKSDLPADESGLSAADKQSLLRLARKTLTEYLNRGTLPEVTIDSPALMQPRAVFVTLRQRETGELRGCRGETVARYPLFEAVMAMAIASAIDDPRFLPVTGDEVPDLHIEISALTPLRPIRPNEIEPGKHGLLLRLGEHCGLLLPQVAPMYHLSQEQFLEALCEKARLPPDAWKADKAQLLGFECEVWEEQKAAGKS